MINKWIEVALTIVGSLYSFSKAVSIVKAIIYAESVLKKLTYTSRRDYIEGHVFEEHKAPITRCRENQCATF